MADAMAANAAQASIDQKINDAMIAKQNASNPSSIGVPTLTVAMQPFIGVPDSSFTPYAPAATVTAPANPQFWEGSFTFGNVSVPKVAVFGGAAALVMIMLMKS